MRGGCPYRHLAAAVLCLAVRDARQDNGHGLDARQFLQGQWCLFLAESLDVADDLARLLSEVDLAETSKS